MNQEFTNALYNHAERKRRKPTVERIGEYRIGKTIGKGNFAVVRLAKHKIANVEVAMKVIDRNRLSEEDLRTIEREIRILKKLSHPHIIKLYEVIRTERFIYLITEYANRGEIFELLFTNGRLEETEARRFFQQITCAIAYCHSRGIAHRDLKAENILIDSQKNIKLIDFGFSNFMQCNALMSTWCGSPPYTAPELLLGKKYDGAKADVWSLGIILYIMVTGGFPFPCDSLDKLKCTLLSDSVNIPFWVSVECSDLIKKLLVVQPAKRFSVAQITQHKWFLMKVPKEIQKLLDETNRNYLNTDPSPPVRINPTVMLFLQQHTNWTEEQVVQELMKKNFDGPIYATYELLCDKVRETFCELEDDSDQPRRGSRGSIVSGKVNVEIEASTPIISAHHLARLSLSNCDDDSDENDVSDSEHNSSSSDLWTHNAVQFPLVAGVNQSSLLSQNRSEVRRHTFCTENLLSENQMLLSMIPPNISFTASVNQNDSSSMDGQTTSNATPIDFAANEMFLPAFGCANFLPHLSLGRSASSDINTRFMRDFNNALNNQQGMEAFLRANPTPFPSCPSRQSDLSNKLSNVEDDGEKYLRQMGTRKRNTVHCIRGLENPAMPTRLINSSPYSKNVSRERHGSWASSVQGPLLNADQQSHLEMIYNQTLAYSNEQLFALRQLHQEIDLLRESSQIMTVPMRQHSGSSLADFNPVNQYMPTISVTDENNMCLLEHSSQDPCDPVREGTEQVAERMMEINLDHISPGEPGLLQQISLSGNISVNFSVGN